MRARDAALRRGGPILPPRLRPRTPWGIGAPESFRPRACCLFSRACCLVCIHSIPGTRVSVIRSHSRTAKTPPTKILYPPVPSALHQPPLNPIYSQPPLPPPPPRSHPPHIPRPHPHTHPQLSSHRDPPLSTLVRPFLALFLAILPTSFPTTLWILVMPHHI